MPTLYRIKRGSMQLQQTAIKAGGRIGVRNVMMLMVVLGLILEGLIQHSGTVVLMALSDPLSSSEFAEYVSNTSYVVQYCQPLNFTAVEVTMDMTDQEGSILEGLGEVVSEDYDELDSFVVDNETTYTGHGRRIAAEPNLKVPLSEEDNIDSNLREVFLWGAFISSLPSSRLAARVGPKRMFGPAVLLSGLMLLCVPFCWFSPYHTAIRFIQGIFTGAKWPSLHMLAANWFPPLQRSGFVACYTAVSVGHALVGLWGTPLIIYAGRDALCYLLTLMSILWFFAWMKLVYDCPSDHPDLSEEKKQHLLTAIGTKVLPKSEALPLPWRHLLSSSPVWACAIASLGNQWGQATLQIAVTKYLKLVYGFSLTYDRVLSVVPHIGHFLAAIAFARVIDHVRGEPLLSTTSARRIFVYISHFFPASVLFIIGYSGCDPAAPAALYTAAVLVSGATPAGSFTSAVDIAPNYAGTVFGLSQTFGMAGSLIGSYVVSEGLHGSLPGSWRLIFGVAAVALVLTAAFFMGYGSGSVQHWNDLRQRRRSSHISGGTSAGTSRRGSIQYPAIALLIAAAAVERRGSIQYRSNLESVAEAEVQTDDELDIKNEMKMTDSSVGNNSSKEDSKTNSNTIEIQAVIETTSKPEISKNTVSIQIESDKLN